MDFELIGQLIRLRYRLLWAKTRSRTGKIALFMAGYLLLMPLLILLSLGGFGAGLAAVRLGRAEQIAQGVLTGLYLTATITSVVLGFGLNAIFSDMELRRYPLRFQERFVARHLTGIVDPFWLLFLALYVGLAIGLWGYGAGSLFLEPVAVVALFISNYLLAQLAAAVLDRVMQKKSGSVLVPLVIFGLCLTPSLVAPQVQKNPAALAGVVRVLRYSAPFGAGSLMTRTDMTALNGFALNVTWVLVLVTALVALETRPRRTRAPQSTRIRWDTPYDRAAAMFSPRYAPLVANWMRFYLRCSRFRIAYLMSIPLVPLLIFIFPRQTHGNPFVTALGIFAIAGFAPTGAFAVNQFGYVGSGFRRYLLLPAGPAATLRSSSYTLVALSSVVLPLSLLGWLLLAPVRSDGRMFLMLLGCGVTGLFLFHGIGLWTTLFGARRADYYATMGNDLSLVGNVVLIGGMLGCLFLPRLLERTLAPLVAPENWWVVIPAALAAGAFYFASLRQTGGILVAKREKLLAMTEGRS